ncbi:MAG: hypothetical protein IT450_08145 [Phycisphaerales bacterium]|nr:hypothetical protein [Phycisphaerales bacterium]
MTRFRLYVAGVFAFLLGIPLTQEAVAQTRDIVRSSFGLAGAIADASGGS